jgi:2-succinyl-5-enolpyruvyl-6-hydroxy-3-cyclohexene-1-carboxylate synthase
MPANARVLLVNNGLGMEFRNYGHPAACLGDDVDEFVAASGHYSAKGLDVVEHFATDMGFEYRRATTKEEYLACLEWFTSPEIGEKPMLLEAMTVVEDEYEALKLIRHFERDAKGAAKVALKGAIGGKGLQAIGKLIRK